MDPAVEQHQLLLDLEARHDELLGQLDELDKRVARVLDECQRLGKADATPSDQPSPTETTQPGLESPRRRAA